jgi:hypothetical protein
MVDQGNLLTIAHLAFLIQVTPSSAKILVLFYPSVAKVYFYPLTEVSIDEPARVRVLRDAARCFDFPNPWGCCDDGGCVLD